MYVLLTIILYLCVEFMTVAKATLAGFVILGLIGFFIKLIHIPINHILVGSA